MAQIKPNGSIATEFFNSSEQGEKKSHKCGKRTKKNKRPVLEQPPMITHWKPTGAKAYQLDMKPTVKRLPRASSPVSSIPAPFIMGQGDGGQLPMRCPRHKGSSTRNSYFNGGSSNSSSESIGTEVKNILKKRCCDYCALNMCCRRKGKPCDVLCECRIILSWRYAFQNHLCKQSSSNKQKDLKLRRETTDPNYLQAWGDVPCKVNRFNLRFEKTDPKIDRYGVNYEWIGWSYYSDFSTEQSYRF